MMDTYEDALEFLNKTDKLSIADIKDIYNNFANKSESYNNLSIENKEKEVITILKYLNAMNIIFCSRYNNSTMTPEEYEVWKLSFKDDFKNIPENIKIEVKKHIYQKFTAIIKNNILKSDDVSSYDKYRIENIRDIKFNKIKICYKYRFLIMLIFLIVIIFVALFVA